MSEHVVSPEAAEAMQRMKDDFQRAEKEHDRTVRMIRSAVAGGVLFLALAAVLLGALLSSGLAEKPEHVVYSYGIEVPGDRSLEVREIVKYEGDRCSTAQIEATFDSEETATLFLERAQRKYASAQLDAFTNKTTAVIQLDVSPSKLDREGYEDALYEAVGAFEIEREMERES